ncbi:MAG: hypothetical protein H0T46_09790 [Deltaproteobacteria bacterium]|nr:hypothetical protein [Deltaproteobacteria bacterium]
MKTAAVLTLVLAAACGGSDEPACDPSGPMCKTLSSYRLFDDIATQTPAEGVVPYALNTPLFSDYTTKDRFVSLPPGESLAWRDDPDSFVAPTGTIVIKTFSYLADRRMPTGDRRLLETRLLIKQDTGWTGASYVYDEGKPSDAILAIAGAPLSASWIHDDGAARTNAYVVPNKNQCKECHNEHDDKLDLLGPKARHLNTGTQLQQLVDLGVVTGAPAAATWPKAVAAYDPGSGTVEQRARAWLDINCAFCHNDRGAARTSGLFLGYQETDALSLGICKPPVAAGRGSGGRAFGIVPGQPDASIMMFRIESTEPDIRMPELGRNLVDAEGASLVRAWIAQLPGSCP